VEKTLVLLKPDAVQRRLIGRIVGRFENKGLKISGMKLMQISPDLAAQHYAEHKERPFYKGLVDFMTSRPVVALCITGPKAVSVVRKLMGATFGFNAEPGTIRGDFGVSNQFNLVHGSDSPESAEREIALFFKAEELLEFPLADDDWNACD
jgi:nucleoside-diphosphate kinase